MSNTLIIQELHFDSAHYLDGTFGKCKYVHGHRYTVKKLVVETSDIVDFNEIKEAIDNFDHCLIIPSEHYKFWTKVAELAEDEGMPFRLIFTTIPQKLALVENIKELLKERLEAIDGVTKVSFDLYETPSYGVKSE